MARGWESKSVESQQADTDRGGDRLPALSPEAQALADKIQGLRLARARVVAELAHATRPAHRAMLEQAAAALDAEISAASR